MKIYTKTGDEGQTGLLGGNRISKDSARIHAIGEIDELNAYVGVCLLHTDHEESAKLIRIQNHLFEIGSELACPAGGKFDITSVTTAEIEELEVEIDDMTKELPELKHFILPGGSPVAAHLHYLRALCRRAERSLLGLHSANPVRSELIIYVNRLSDWIFCFSRFSNHGTGIAEQKWTKGTTK